MLETYMKNKGTTKTIFHNNNTNIVKEYDWDVDYDGDKARVSIDSKENGRPGHYELEFDNNDLANILKVNSVKKPINQRLLDDFNFNDFNTNNFNEPNIIKIENTTPSLLKAVNNSEFQNPIENPLQNMLYEIDNIKENTYPSLVIDIIKSKPKTRKRHKRIIYKQNPITNVQIKKYKTKKRPNVKIHRVFRIPKTQDI
jgi:hypothetical protein